MPLGYTVNFGGTTLINGTTLNDVLTVSTSKGRQWQTDPYSPSSCTITSRNISAWTTAPKVGNLIGVKTNSTFATVVFGGWIKDVQIVYGTIPALDVAYITCEGPLSRFGRRTFKSRSFAQADYSTYLFNLATAVNYLDYSTYGSSSSIYSAQTYAGNALDLLNLIVTSEIGFIDDQRRVSNLPDITFAPRTPDTTVDVGFTDQTGADYRYLFYQNITFKSAAQNYYTQVTINPQGLTTQQAETGSAPYVGLDQESLDYTNAQALSHAQYLLYKYNTTNSNIVSFTANYANQKTADQREYFDKAIYQLVCGGLVTVDFRGTTYNLIVEGVNLSADPSNTELEIFVSSQDNNNYLILNDSIFGTLNYNKLGF